MDQAWNCVPRIGRRIPNQRTSREVLPSVLTPVSVSPSLLWMVSSTRAGTTPAPLLLVHLQSLVGAPRDVTSVSDLQGRLTASEPRGWAHTLLLAYINLFPPHT